MTNLIASWQENYSAPLFDDGVITFSMDSEYLGDVWRAALARIDEVLAVDVLEVESGGELRVGSAVSDPTRYAGYARPAKNDEIVNWTLMITRERYTEEFLNHVVYHEIGHALGLRHPDDGSTTADSVMSTDYSGGFDHVEFHRRDWDTLTGLYGGTFTAAEPVEEVVEVVEVVEEVEVVEVVEEVEPQGFVLSPKKEKKLDRLIDRGRVEKAVRKLDKWGAFDGFELNQRLTKNTFTAQEERGIIREISEEDWLAISSRDFFNKTGTSPFGCSCALCQSI